MVRKLLVLSTFLAPLFLSAQQKKIDSLYTVIKTEREDTGKVNTLNLLSRELWLENLYDTAIICSDEAQALAEKLKFKSGEANALTAHGIICEDKGDLVKALKCEEEALAINQEAGDRYGLAKNLYEMGVINDEQSNYSEALEFFTKASAAFQQIGDKKGLCNTYGEIGNVYNDEGSVAEALDFYFKALTLNKGLNNKHGIATNMSNIGTLYHKQGDYAKAIEYDTSALAINRVLGNKHGIATCLGNLGTVYHSMGDYQKALKYHLASLQIFEEIGAQSGIGMSLTNVGDIYMEQAKQVKSKGQASDSLLSKALDYFIRSRNVDSRVGDKRLLSYAYTSIGLIYMSRGNYKYAHQFFDSSLAISRTIGEKASLQDVYFGFAKLDSCTGNYYSAFMDYKNYIAYRDSIMNEANTKKTVQAEMTYQFEQKQVKEKAEQEKKDAVAGSEKKKQQILTASVSLGLLVVLAFSGILFSRFKVTQKQKKIIEDQKALVEEKNKEVLDSITYAKRLQDAILPPLTIIYKYLPDSFVLYKPKDIVAGDFYWMEQANGSILIAACDCTGHGVPGAMVSVVCSNALNRTVKEFKITEPGKILDKVRELVLETFEKSEGEIKDGMDVSLCCINMVTKEIRWSGAHNPLWFVQSGELKELAPNKQPIGAFDLAKPFNTASLQLQQGDSLYLFTDGYADQFGGPKGKKFKYKQLQELIVENGKLKIEEQKKVLEQKFEEWKGNLEQVDDVLVIGIRV